MNWSSWLNEGEGEGSAAERAVVRSICCCIRFVSRVAVSLGIPIDIDIDIDPVSILSLGASVSESSLLDSMLSALVIGLGFSAPNKVNVTFLTEAA